LNGFNQLHTWIIRIYIIKIIENIYKISLLKSVLPARVNSSSCPWAFPTQPISPHHSLYLWRKRAQRNLQVFQFWFFLSISSLCLSDCLNCFRDLRVWAAGFREWKYTLGKIFHYFYFLWGVIRTTVSDRPFQVNRVLLLVNLYSDKCLAL